jgi:hypothetical protein
VTQHCRAIFRIFFKITIIQLTVPGKSSVFWVLRVTIWTICLTSGFLEALSGPPNKKLKQIRILPRMYLVIQFEAVSTVFEGSQVA